MYEMISPHNLKSFPSSEMVSDVLVFKKIFMKLEILLQNHFIRKQQSVKYPRRALF